MSAEEYVRAHCLNVEVVQGQIRINDAQGGNVVVLGSTWEDAKIWVERRLIIRRYLEEAMAEFSRGLRRQNLQQ